MRTLVLILDYLNAAIDCSKDNYAFIKLTLETLQILNFHYIFAFY